MISNGKHGLLSGVCYFIVAVNNEKWEGESHSAIYGIPTVTP